MGIIKYTGICCSQPKCPSKSAATIMCIDNNPNDLMCSLRLPPAWDIAVTHSDLKNSVRVVTVDFRCHLHGRS